MTLDCNIHFYKKIQVVSLEFIVSEQREIAKNGTTQLVTQSSGGPPIEGVTVTK